MTGRLLGTSLLDSVTLTATSEAGAYTVSNLVATQPGKLWRSTSAAAQTITGDLGEDKRINGFVLYAHNLSNDGSATVQLTLSNNSGHTDQVYDTTVEATDPLYGWGEGGMVWRVMGAIQMRAGNSSSPRSGLRPLRSRGIFGSSSPTPQTAIIMLRLGALNWVSM